MTMTIDPTGAARDRPADVRSRREAALERINGGPTRTRRSGASKRGKPTRRAVRMRDARAPERLGPPPGIYYWIGLTVAAFVMLGLVMVLSATSAREMASSDDPYHTFFRQTAWAACGVVGMLIVLKVPYQRWRALVIPGSILAVGLMMLTFVPGVGATINDANSWVRIGGFGFQPLELLKVASIAFLADYFTRHEHEMHDKRHGMYPFALVAGLTGVLVFAQGDLGGAIVLFGVCTAMAVIASVPFRHVGLVTLVAFSIGLMAIMSSPRRFRRITAFRDIEGNKEHLAFQSWQGLLSIANGGWTGSGIGGSRSKLGYLPYAHSDFIFAVIADELGFIGSVAVIGGFGLIVWFGIQAALAAPDRFGMLLAGGIASYFGIQVVINVGGVAGVLPVTGLTLPFFSAGGTSLFVSMLLAALLLNVARRAVTAPRTSRPITKGRRPSRRITSRARSSLGGPDSIVDDRVATLDGPGSRVRHAPAGRPSPRVHSRA